MCKVELVYVNNITPFVAKVRSGKVTCGLSNLDRQKFFMLAQLVEVTSVQEVVRGLKAGKQRLKEDVLKTSKSSQHFL